MGEILELELKLMGVGKLNRLVVHDHYPTYVCVIKV